MSADLDLARKLNRYAWVASVLVILLVGMMRQVKIEVPWDMSFLPPFHASMNALTAVVLLIALYFIKQKNVAAHQKAIYVAMGFSVLFLLSYVAYHFTTPETLFGDVDGNGVVSDVEKSALGGIRMAYLVLLLTHVILAALILPFILFTFIRGFTGQVERHRKMARWVWPLWFYVAVTGPILYYLIAPYY